MVDNILSLTPQEELIFKGPWNHESLKKTIFLKNKTFQNIIYQIQLKDGPIACKIYPKCGLIPPQSSIKVNVILELSKNDQFWIKSGLIKEMIIITISKTHENATTNSSGGCENLLGADKLDLSNKFPDLIFTKCLKVFIIDPGSVKALKRTKKTRRACSVSESSCSSTTGCLKKSNSYSKYKDSHSEPYTMASHDINRTISDGESNAMTTTIISTNYQETFPLKHEYKLLKRENHIMKILKEELGRACINETQMKNVKKQLSMFKVWNIVNAMGYFLIIGCLIGYLLNNMIFDSDSSQNESFGNCKEGSNCKSASWFWVG
ncbi:unnamed protein product [Gordionus sp. m RMFG-2023]